MSARDDYPPRHHYTDGHEATYVAMADEIDRLRAENSNTLDEYHSKWKATIERLQDEIDRLRAEIERLSADDWIGEP